MPNLVLKAIMRIRKVYGAEICVFMARLRGVTSGLTLAGNFWPFLAIFVDQRTFFFILYNWIGLKISNIYFEIIKNLIFLLIKRFLAKICGDYKKVEK